MLEAKRTKRVSLHPPARQRYGRLSLATLFAMNNFNHVIKLCRRGEVEVTRYDGDTLLPLLAPLAYHWHCLLLQRFRARRGRKDERNEDTVYIPHLITTHMPSKANDFCHIFFEPLQQRLLTSRYREATWGKVLGCLDVSEAKKQVYH